MNRRLISVLGATALVCALPVATASSASAVPDRADEPRSQQHPDNRPDDLSTKRTETRQRAVDALVRGDATLKGSGESRTIEMKAKGKKKSEVIDYPATQDAQLLSFLVEFGDQKDDRFPDAPAGPSHNEIPEPAEEDNSTYWTDDFSPQHFKDMFFNGLPDQNGESFKGVYDEMSSGQFNLEGDVSDWVTVPNNEASYGQTESAVDMTRFIQDSANAWYQQQIDAGKSKAEIEEYLKSYDVWDRFDLDGDGVFNEPDGYIDHFQAIHAGEGEEAGAPEWAIWSHRWAANWNGSEGPEDYPKAGGIKIGDTDLWIRDYTTEPENGGLGVFAHEFGHDLGLPDFYDTQGGENGTGFWTLMSSGSWLGHGDGAIGTTPNHMGPAEKLFLGWYGPNNEDLAIVEPGEGGQVDLGPSYHATNAGKQAAAVLLPDGVATVDAGDASSGDGYLYSGTGDERTSTATSTAFTVPDGGQLTAKAAYSLEADWDYAYAEVSTDGGTTFEPVETNLSSTTNPNGGNDGFGITGTTDADCEADPGSVVCSEPNSTWTDLTADLSAFAGQEVQLRFRQSTDTATHEFGFKVDDVAVGDAFADDFESGFGNWTLSTGDTEFYGITGGGYEVTFEHYYLVENRQYRGYDTTLAEGPYNFSFLETSPNQVEHYPYQDGLLVWYVNGMYADNNTSIHPGYGQALPVDANATALTWSDDTIARNRIQSFDATFDVDSTDGISLTQETGGGAAASLDIPAHQSTAVFDDTDIDNYYDPDNPQGSTKVGGTGTKIEVLKSKEKKGKMVIEVTR